MMSDNFALLFRLPLLLSFSSSLTLTPSASLYSTISLTLSIPIIYRFHTLLLPSPSREMRKRRKLDLEEHLSQKPGENDDDIRDNTAIKLAERTVGDYKLKVAEDYEITEECRINATKKKSQVCHAALCSPMLCYPVLTDASNVSHGQPVIPYPPSSCLLSQLTVRCVHKLILQTHSSHLPRKPPLPSLIFHPST
jgi:hypothetical protein